MGIIDTLTEWQFVDRFRQSETYKHNFTDEALSVLYNYLWELSEDIGEPIEFDLVAIACDFSEYGCIADLRAAFPDESDRNDDNIEFLEEMESSYTCLAVEQYNADDTYIVSS